MSTDISVVVNFYDTGFQTSVRQKLNFTRVPALGECVCFTPVDRLTQTPGSDKKWFEVTLVVHNDSSQAGEKAEIWAVEVDSDVELQKSTQRMSGAQHR